MCFRNLEPIGLGVGNMQIRAPRLEDVPALTAGLAHAEVTRMLASLPYPCPEQIVAGWVEIALARRANGNGLEFVIADSSDAGGAAVGMVGFSSFGKIADLGYWLSPPAQGRGLMTAAAGAALACAFAHGALTIQSGAFTDNPASLKIQHKLGFDTVGESRIYSLARRRALAHIDTRLDAERFIENGSNR